MAELDADFRTAIRFDSAGLAALGPTPRAITLAEPILRRELVTWFARQPTPRQPHLTALALWWHDHLDAAHVISQELDGVEGAYIHGLMHRREPDDDNAAYWATRVGAHPVHAQLEPLARATLPWWPAQPFALAFITAAAQVRDRPGSADELVLRRLQAQEAAALTAHWLGGLAP